MNKKATPPANKANPAAAAAAVDGDSTQALYTQIRDVLSQARQQVRRNINQAMVQTYWQVGRLIVAHEQAGQTRAAYGERVLNQLAERLSAEFGTGFAVQSLRNYRQFYLTLPGDDIRSTPWSELGWSHLRALMRVADPAARLWYAREAVSQTWSVAALSRQISTLYYQRLLSSQDRDGVQAEAQALITRDAPPDPRDFIRDPYVLEFLQASPAASLYEKDLEQGLLDQLQKFLLELGKGFAFVARQRHLRNEAVARYSLLAEGRQLFASRYQPWLPTEAELQAELTRDRARLELAQPEDPA
ncbi:PDDEXK nuclease domain-containing protein [Sphaerotilus mobilis]|uniref:Putative nuclease of restriction endonuclease-like (RecB) superfamily n=1 Tax=Sphaerotilus mobilis TaxID=47994 RepID=A0A4Q7LFQ2_9BURK|nr:PDDEXK nuclease domain-containing protein [Sphaerotilus mobilis]RZS53296.1 putative nuclease of restriction endonuclease-like (RecB) superfamily [Sphaerotilus mobilis]